MEWGVPPALAVGRSQFGKLQKTPPRGETSKAGNLQPVYEEEFRSLLLMGLAIVTRLLWAA